MPTRIPTAARCALALTALAACGPDPSLADASATDAPVERHDPPPPPPLRCGAMTCATNQVCVFPCVAATLHCFTPVDGGACPDGWTRGTCPPDTTPNGCLEPQPPTMDPYCFDLPPACGGTAACGCLPSTACRPTGTCRSVSSRDVMCGC